jgi:hypothetical protein
VHLWSTEADPAHPYAVALFIGFGTVGWTLLGICLFLVPGVPAAVLLALSFACVGVQYAAWWQLGASPLLLWPLSVRQMGRSIGLSDWVSFGAIYGAFAVILAGLVAWGEAATVPPVGPGRDWLATLGSEFAVTALIAMVLAATLGAADPTRSKVGPYSYWRYQPSKPSFRDYQRARTIRLICHPLYRLGFASATLAIFSVVAART